MLEIKNEGGNIAIYVDGVQVWSGTMSDWSRAISRPQINKRAA